MKKPAKSKKKRDANELAFEIMRHATGESSSSESKTEPSSDKDPIAVELGRRGGKVGGKARAAKLSAKRRKEIAKGAAKKRWSKARKSS